MKKSNGARVSVSAGANFFRNLSDCAAELGLPFKRRARAVCTIADLRAGQSVLLVGKNTAAMEKAAQKRGCIVTVRQTLFNANAAARYDSVILFENANDALSAATFVVPDGRLTVCALCGRYQANRIGASLVSARALSSRLADAFTIDVCIDTPTLFVLSGRLKSGV